MTAEDGPGPFMASRESTETAFGAEKVGVKTSQGGEVVQPPEYAMYAYDFTRVLSPRSSMQAARATGPSSSGR